MDDKNKYFAQRNAKECVSVLQGKIGDWVNRFQLNGYLDKVTKSWQYYHGIFNAEGFEDAHGIRFTGEQGELMRLNVNNYRTNATNQLNLITQTRPKIDCRSVNNDFKSKVQRQLGSGLINYYMREKDIERRISLAAEYAIVLGSGYIKIDWDEQSGEQVAYNEETDTAIFDGDLKFTNHSPLDVIFDPNRDMWSSHDWVIVRTQTNKYDLIAKYPDLEKQLLGVQVESDKRRFSMLGSSLNDTDLVDVFEFIHNRTPAMPNGRYIKFCDSETVMLDAPMPYRVMNVYRISPADILGSSFGYTTMFDLLPLQEGENVLHSSVFTNLATFGVQNVIVPEDGGYNIQSLGGGMNLIKGDMSKGVPQGLNLTKVAPEAFSYIQTLAAGQQSLSGMNSVVQGNPEASIRSAAAMGIMQAQAVQSVSGLQKQYTKLIEDIGTGMIRILQDFATTPRLANIVGVNKRNKLVEFVGEDINAINRVVCTIGNPIQETIAGRVNMADNLLQYKQINAKQYINVMTTGDIEEFTDNVEDTYQLIEQENELMLSGEMPLVLWTDEHDLHIQKHREVLNNPFLRYEPEIVKACMDHINEHISILKNFDPMSLAVIQQSSLAAPAPPPGMPPEGAPPMDEGMAPPPPAPEGMM